MNLYEDLKSKIKTLDDQYHAIYKNFIIYNGYEDVDANLSIENIIHELIGFVVYYKDVLSSADVLQEEYSSKPIRFKGASSYTHNVKTDEFTTTWGFVRYETFKDSLLSLIYLLKKSDFEISKFFGYTIIHDIGRDLVAIYSSTIGNYDEFVVTEIADNLTRDVARMYNKVFDTMKSYDLIYDAADLNFGEDELLNLEELLNKEFIKIGGSYGRKVCHRNWATSKA